VLGRLGVKPLAEQGFRLADGSRLTRQEGGATFGYRDAVGVANVILGEEGDDAELLLAQWP